LKWEFSSEHKPLTDIEVNAIVALASFPGRVGTRQLLPGKVGNTASTKSRNFSHE